MAKSPKRTAPAPIFDNLDQIDPQTPPSSLSALDCATGIDVLVDDAALVIRFLRSYDGSRATL